MECLVLFTFVNENSGMKIVELISNLRITRYTGSKELKGKRNGESIERGTGYMWYKEQATKSENSVAGVHIDCLKLIIKIDFFVSYSSYFYFHFIHSPIQYNTNTMM